MIVIAPYAKQCMNGRKSPKNYPHWQKIIEQVSEPIIQVGVEGEEQLVPDFRKNLSVSELRKLLRECRIWVSCDSFVQHLGWDEGKQGIVLWSVSDPLIFGHPENINLLKSRDYLRENQFLWWEDVPYNEDAFVDAKVVIDLLLQS
jgi:ADP-heptose:LPS heptosyltransferase